MIRQLSIKFAAVIMMAALTSSNTVVFAQHSLDLTSQERCCGATESATITVGDATRQIQAGEMITPAELIAIRQVITTGTQTILLTSTGTAQGGTISVSNLPAVANLIVPTGVTALYDSGSNATMNIAGQFSNAGQFYLFSTNQNVTSATINAANIANYGLLSSILPAGLVSGAVPNFSFVLNAAQNIFNSGTISSAGNLNLIAGNSVINQSLPTNTATMSAVANLSVVSPSLFNTGNIAALTGNLNIGSMLARDLVINNMRGLLQAAQGQLNINTAPYNAATNVLMSGGDVIARELSIFAPSSMRIDQTNITGTVNAKAQDLTILAGANGLTIGTIDATGDPLIATPGTVQLTSQIHSGDALSVVAGQDILVSGKSVSIDTSSATGSGGDVLMAAGAAYTPSGGGILITGGTAGGGRIDLNIDKKNYVSNFSTKGSGANASGGDVTMLAFEGTRTKSGEINMPTGVTLTTGGTGSGSAGNVLMIAGSQDTGGSALKSSNIDTTGGSSGGSVSLYAATPTVIDPVAVSSTGSIESGTFGVDLTKGGNLILGDDLSIKASSDVTLYGYRDVVLDQGSNPGVGTTISAGVLEPGTATDTNIAPAAVLSKGSINVRSGTKDVMMKRGSSLTSVGDDLVIQAGRDMTLQSDATVQALGGNVGLFTDTGSILVENSSLIKAVGMKGPNCPGGGVYIWTESPGITLPQAEAQLQPVWGTFYQQGSIKDVHSIFSPPDPESMGYIEAIVSGLSPDHIQAHHSGFYTVGADVRGGIISMRTPGEPNSKNIIFQKSNVIAINDCRKKPEPPEPPVPPVPPQPPVKPVVPSQKQAQGKSVQPPPVFTLQFENPTVIGTPQHVWTVTYAPPSYLENTAQAKIVVVGGKYDGADERGTKLNVAGYTVHVSDSDARAVNKAAIVMRDEQQTTCGAIALGASAKGPIDINIGQERHKLYPGAMLLISQPLVNNGSGNLAANVACVRPLTASSASLPETLPRTVLLHTKEVPLRNELHHTLPQTTSAVAERTQQNVQTPIAYSEPTTLQSTKQVKHFPGTCFVRNAEIRQTGFNHYSLKRGQMLASLDRRITIDTPQGSLIADAGSVILVAASHRLTRVRNLTDDHAAAVRMYVGKAEAIVEPGKEYNVSLNSSDLMSVVLADGLARRSIMQAKHGSAHVVAADFSILHALLSQPLLTELRASQGTVSDRIMDKIMKTAASLSLVVDRYKGPYYAQPRGITGGIAERTDEQAL